MSVSIPTIEPEEIIAGDNATWKITVSDYPASGGWSLIYAFRGGGTAIAITATTSGDDYLITLTPSITSLWAAGTYRWQSHITKTTPAESHPIATGMLVVKARLSTQTAGYDPRSQIKKTLDAISALLEGKAVADVMSYTIAGRSIAKMTPEELIKWQNNFQIKYDSELKAEKIAQGLGGGGRVLVRF
ncbi:MAG: hypothetical protein WC623_24680 [Pedobacter sp.]|uniref:hypothetical protein n=1 Tax=Pedobacter sp. TaxID=1411316 RepID=UPI00356A6E51